MLVTEVTDLAPLEAVNLMTADLAVRIYERHGTVWPVSGDSTAQISDHLNAREAERTALAMTRRTVVAAGRLLSADSVQLVQVQCADCPWGLTVHGWDAGADKLAQRHSNARRHRVHVEVCR